MSSERSFARECGSDAARVLRKIGCWDMMIKKQNVLKGFTLLIMVALCGCTGKDMVENENLKPEVKNSALQKENLKFSEQIHRINSQVNMAEIKANLAGLRTAISIYYDDNGAGWPVALEELSPRYIAKIPEGDWNYNPATGKLISKSHPGW